MDEQEFYRLLDLFPVVRSRDYRADLDTQGQSTSRSVQVKEQQEWQDAWNDGERTEFLSQHTDSHDEFWAKLKLAAERKVGPVEAERFCEAFRKIHNRLVYEELSFDTARSFMNSPKRS